MRSQTVKEIIARIDEAARAEPGGAIAFDGDGTLWTGDIGEDYFAALVASGEILPVAHDALVREAAAGKVETHGTAVELARRIHAAYLAGSFPEERVCEIMTWAVAGWAREKVKLFAARVIAETELRARLHSEAIHVLEHARRSNIEVLLVSASPRAIVAQAATVVGIDDRWVAAATEVHDEAGVVQPSVLRPIPYGGGKVTRLRELVGTRPLYAAFGDNAFDVPMLREAKIPVMIRPKQRLLDRAAEIPGVAILVAT